MARVRVPALGVVLTRLPHRARVATTGSTTYAADRQRRRTVPAGPVPPVDPPLPPHQP